MSSGDQVRINAIHALYQQELGRDATSAEVTRFTLKNEQQNYQTSTAQIREIVRGTDEYFRRQEGIAGRAPRYGVGLNELAGTLIQDQTFDSADYTHALWEGGEYNVSRTRVNILNWLQHGEGKRWLDPADAEGQLMQDILATKGTGGQIHTRWGDVMNYPHSVDTFNFPDLHATRAMGFSEAEIQEWLDEKLAEDPSILAPQHHPDAAGGVYEAVRSGTPIDTTLDPISVTYNPIGEDWSMYEPSVPPAPEPVDTSFTTSSVARQSLNIEPNTAHRNIWMEGNLRACTGDVRRRIGNLRPKYTSTKDLSRERRNSLNIS